MLTRTRMLAVLCTAATAAVAGWVWLSSAPLGVPREWTWPRIEFSGQHGSAWLLALISAGAYLAVVAAASVRFHQHDRPSDEHHPYRPLVRGLWLTVIVAGAFGWWYALLSATPEPYGMGRAPFVLYYERMTGYFTEARNSPASTREFLSGYEAWLAGQKDQQRYLHLGTHPPGMILMYRGMLAAQAQFPVIDDAVRWTMPAAIRASNRQITTSSADTERPFREGDGICLWVATVLSIAASAAAIWPLYLLLVRQGAGRSSAVRWASLWAFVPAVGIFLPKCDTLFAFPALVMAWLWLSGLDRRSWWRPFAAGVICFGGMFFSLVFLPIAAWLGLTTILEGAKARRAGTVVPGVVGPAMPREIGIAITIGLAGFTAPLAAFWFGLRQNVLHVWQLNFLNHAEFYQHNSRSYGLWLAANVGELAIALGPAALVAAIFGAWLAVRRLLQPEGLRLSSAVAAAAILATLWLSGKNMGEAARLWIPLLPWGLLLANISEIVRSGRGGERGAIGAAVPGDRADDGLWWVVAINQAVAAILISTRIDGFGFSELL